jgi:hypothetical protein
LWRARMLNFSLPEAPPQRKQVMIAFRTSPR